MAHKFEIYKDKAGEYRVRFSYNSEVMFSTQGYSSKDSAKKHLNFIAKHELTTPLATDAEEGGLSDALGVWAEKKMYGKTFMGIQRSTFLIDEEGKIAHIWPKVKVAGHVDEVKATIEGLTTKAA